GVLCGVISQRLLPRIDGGRVPAVEVMVNKKRIEELIRENRGEEIPTAIADGEYFDMQTMADALIDLVIDGQVERETAATAATNRHDFLLMLERAEKSRANAERVLAAAASTDDLDLPQLRVIDDAGAD